MSVAVLITDSNLKYTFVNLLDVKMRKKKERQNFELQAMR